MVIDLVQIPPHASYQGRVSPEDVKELDAREIRFAAHLDRFAQRQDDIADAIEDMSTGMRLLESRLIQIDRRQRSAQIEVKPYIAILRTVGAAIVGALVVVIINHLTGP